MREGTQLGRVIGRVSLSTGQPIADAVVMITGDSPTHPDIAALTNLAGEYRFEALAPGRYTILVNAEEHALRTQHVQVEAGKTARLDFALAV